VNLYIEAESVGVAIGLGSNIEPRASSLKEAISQLPSVGIEVKAVSKVYETKALLPTGAPSSWDIDYLNVVVFGHSAEHPTVVLPRLQQIEVAMGRSPAPKWAPRCIDIDVLIWGRSQIATQQLQIPHPQITERPFVYVPLLEVWPDVDILTVSGWQRLSSQKLKVAEQGGVLSVREEIVLT
jgi:2-amino-4-hydroxy-6-hydroxymethyldihydropteridine diphosphokinase